MRKISALLTILIIATVIGWATWVYAVSSTPATIPTTGTTTPISLAFFLVSEPTQISWGNIEQGESVTETVTLTNNGNAGASGLTMETSGDNIADLGLTLSWDCAGQPISAGESLVATFTLTASASAPAGDWGFDIVVNGATS